jgi:hypothetical protein
MYRLWIVSVPALVLYFAVTVVLPGVKPVSRNVALAFTKALPIRFSANGSLAAAVLAPLIFESHIARVAVAAEHACGHRDKHHA